MKTAVLIITRGDRPKFLEQAKKLISDQTMQPDFVEIVDDKPKSNEVDITYRYRIGVERCKQKGADCIIFWEDDDYYAPTYIQRMVGEWTKKGCPDILGISSTIYYNVVTLKYVYLSHPGRASMMSTMINAKAQINWGDDSYAYTDMILWRQLKGFAVSFNERLNIGIKHGTGLCGGGGHQTIWAHYNQEDQDYSFLKQHIKGQDLEFYKQFKMKDKYIISKKKYSEKPFLSIVTRKYLRPVGFSKNQESIEQLIDKDLEQIFIEDNYGHGLHEANKSFALVKNDIEGEYVFLLDDDDFITNRVMLMELKHIAKFNDPDVICFKMHIKNANNCLYPTDDCWGKYPIRGSIGGSCFVVKRDIYQRFIHFFGEPRMGDFYFIDQVFKSGAKFYWHDKKMCETGKVSRGAKE